MIAFFSYLPNNSAIILSFALFFALNSEKLCNFAVETARLLTLGRIQARLILLSLNRSLADASARCGCDVL